MEDSIGQGVRRDAGGDQLAGLADDRLVRTNLGRQAGTRGEPTFAPFDVVRIDHPLGVVLRLDGELDVATVPLLQEQLDRATRAGGAVVIDLTGLRFIDSSGLHLLVRAEEQLRASGGQLMLVHGPPAVRRVFELTGLDRYFAWCDSPSTALRTTLERRVGSRRIAKPAADRQTVDQLDRGLRGVMGS
jgi:anti-anti-sigma factor